MYSAKTADVATYSSPDGKIHSGRVVLKRMFDIREARLLDVNETFRLTPTVGGYTDTVDTQQEYLVQQLASNRSGTLNQVVATIQPDQYRLIAEEADQILLIQGVAGIGKSVIGLHRIAYLLSPFHDTKVDPARIVIFGPSRVFLRYVSNLLPSLNVHSVQHLAVKDWLLNGLSESIRVEPGEAHLERLIRYNSETSTLALETLKFKGSLNFARLLERHVEILRRRYQSVPTPITATIGSRIIEIPADQMRTLIRALPKGDALNSQRQHLIDEVIQLLLAGQQNRPDRSDVEKVVEAQLDRFWPWVDFRKEYRTLLGDSTRMKNLAAGSLTEEQARAITTSLKKELSLFGREDLGCVAYLDHLLNEHPNAEFQHVVIDEAQELAPIEFLLMRRHRRGDSLTILGDLTQSLSPQGIDNWGEMLRLFRGTKVSRFRIRHSYRSTSEITLVSNKVLKAVSPNATSASAQDRHGPRPQLFRSRTYQEMVSRTSEIIN